ncbi:hypothetical protein YC2023_120041 [Brassica napus]
MKYFLFELVNRKHPTSLRERVITLQKQRRMKVSTGLSRLAKTRKEVDKLQAMNHVHNLYNLVKMIRFHDKKTFAPRFWTQLISKTLQD